MIHNVHVLVVEGRQAGHHLVDEHAKGPPINGFGIPLAFEELRSDIFWCATKGCWNGVQLAKERTGGTGEQGPTRSLLRLGHVQFAQAEITESNVARIVQEDILGLQVTIDDVEAV